MPNMINQKEVIPEFLYKYITRLLNENRTLLMDVNDGLKDIDYNVYMYLIGDDITASERLRREQFIIQLYQTPNFQERYTYVETKFIAKFRSRDCIVYLYRALDGRIAVGDNHFHYDESDEKYHLTKEEIEKTDKQFLSLMKPVDGYWWQK